MVLNVVLVGDGAREHIIAERLSEDSNVYAVMSKKNPGLIRISKQYAICNIKDKDSVRSAVQSFGVDFDVGFVSPDPCLAAGLTDVLSDMGIPMASPTKEASRIEWDKAFSRSLMHDYGIPGLPDFVIVNDPNVATMVINDFGECAVKPIGLTGGKGVKIVPEHLCVTDAIEYSKELIAQDGKVVIEERLVGEEFTLQAFTDGKRLAIMPPVQDHKRLLEGDKGPNTGGMGSYSTGNLLPFLTEGDISTAVKILHSTLWALRKEGTPFVGVLYGQFMLTSDGVKLIEFNSRFGDPEAMNVLSLLNCSLSDIFLSMSDGNICPVKFYDLSTVVKYIVPKGYPTNPDTDSPLHIDENSVVKEGARLYYASVYEESGIVFTTGSRSLGVVSMADDLFVAETEVENAIKHIRGNVYHRRDIGTRDMIEAKIRRVSEITGRNIDINT